MNWRDEYKRLWLADKMTRFEDFYTDCEDPMCYLRLPKENTANGLTQLIIKFLTWKGHYANRIGTQGQAKMHNVPRFDIFAQRMLQFTRVKWIKGSTKKGTPDITAIINGRPVWIEVKIGRDRMSADQEVQQEAIVHAGGIYYIAKNMQDFYEWYYELIEQI